MNKYEYEEGRFHIGLIWGTIFSIPLWISIIGWIKIIFG